MTPYNNLFSLMVTSLLLLAAFVATSIHAQEEGVGYEGLCGDCWCTTATEDESCPELGNDFTYYPNQDWAVLETFNLLSPTISLQVSPPDSDNDNEDGTTTASPADCSPFRELLGDQIPDSFPQGQYPPCVINPPQTGNYCGYKYPSSSAEEEEIPACNGRDYEMMSYDTLEELEADGAQLIHAGACGVCSNAGDVWIKMDTLDSISPRTTFCAVSYITSQDFNALIECLYDIGYTYECAFQWAHYAVIQTLLCAGDCIPDTSNTIVGNGDPPECKLTPCFECAQEKYAFDDLHYTLTGFSGLKGGVIDRAPSYNCSDYQPVTYDPCVGADPDKSPTTGANGGQSTDQNDSSNAPATAKLTHATSFGLAAGVVAAVVVSPFGTVF